MPSSTSPGRMETDTAPLPAPRAPTSRSTIADVTNPEMVLALIFYLCFSPLDECHQVLFVQRSLASDDLLRDTREHRRGHITSLGDLKYPDTLVRVFIHNKINVQRKKKKKKNKSRQENLVSWKDPDPRVSADKPEPLRILPEFTREPKSIAVRSLSLRRPQRRKNP
ncbi:hypothetical protein F2P81_015594 [Scophthalmus maximus]|uniref:Uncharacterized protein n=1 Tax=Scophthalmus maximus TaxID=52904 RepID=A0A6A4SQK1_SCOMX|nr:hypothetical protein F2P81_015594 [Scophthalmus maximus]